MEMHLALLYPLYLICVSSSTSLILSDESNVTAQSIGVY